MNDRGLPFKGFSEEEKKRIKYVISDVDDTITCNGQISLFALEALYSLRLKEKNTFLVTGGSYGWGDCYMRQWPVDGVLAESGAVLFVRDEDDSVQALFNPIINQAEVIKKKNELLKRTEGLPLSSDQPARLFDIAYDKNKMDEDEIKVLKNILSFSGAYYSESSIHINAWFGDYRKLSAVKYFLSKVYKIKERDLLDKGIYIGDSFNDQELFGYFPLSIGMHSVEEKRKGFKTLPKYITKEDGGLGFYAVVDAL